MTSVGRVRTSVIVLSLLSGAKPHLVAADETPRTGVVDRAGVMRGSDKQRLDSLLLELEQKTGAQLKVLIVPSTDGQDIYQFSIDTARRWRLGQKGKNNGALVVIAVNDHKYHIQVGEGIEHALPDVLCFQVEQTYFVPNFRAGNYSKGIYEGTIELARTMAKDAGVELSGLPVGRIAPRQLHGRVSCFGAALPFIVLLFIIGGAMSSARNRNSGGWMYGRRGRFSPGSFVAGMLLNSLFSGSSRGWGSGGSNWGGGSDWGGGGGGGGFGGGGGGSFGGGGAGGSW